MIAEVKRELAMRKGVYFRAVGAHKMRASEADWCLTCMHAVLLTLETLPQDTKTTSEMVKF